MGGRLIRHVGGRCQNGSIILRHKMPVDSLQTAFVGRRHEGAMARTRLIVRALPALSKDFLTVIRKNPQRGSQNIDDRRRKRETETERERDGQRKRGKKTLWVSLNVTTTSFRRHWRCPISRWDDFAGSRKPPRRPTNNNHF